MELENLKEERSRLLKDRRQNNAYLKKLKKSGKQDFRVEDLVELTTQQIKKIEAKIKDIEKPRFFCDMCGKELKRNYKYSKCPVCGLESLRSLVIDNAKRIMEYRSDPRNLDSINKKYRQVATSLYDYTCSSIYSICDIFHKESGNDKLIDPMYEHVFGREKSSRFILDTTIKMVPENLTSQILHELLLISSFVVRIQKYEKKHTDFNSWMRQYQHGNTSMEFYNEGLELHGFTLIPEDRRSKFDPNNLIVL